MSTLQASLAAYSRTLQAVAREGFLPIPLLARNQVSQLQLLRTRSETIDSTYYRYPLNHLPVSDALRNACSSDRRADDINSGADRGHELFTACCGRLLLLSHRTSVSVRGLSEG